MKEFMKKENTNKNNKIEKLKETLPLCHTDGLPYYSDIRMSWLANQRHCDPNMPDGRKTLIEKHIQFCPEWLGELGWVRFYLYCLDKGYVSGKSQLIRVDDSKDFSPSNCKVVDKVVKEKKAVSSKTKAPKTQYSTNTKTDSMTPASINNHFMIFTSDGMKSQDIIELLKSVSNQPIDDEHNKIIYFDTVESQSIKQRKAKN